jgi:hypothetical protein
MKNPNETSKSSSKFTNTPLESEKPKRKRTRRGKPAQSKDWSDMSSIRVDQPDYRTVDGADRAGSNLVFPTQSAAAAAFGSFTTSPGQDNFIEGFNQVRHEHAIGVLRNLTFSEGTRRTPSAMAIQFLPYFGAIQPSKDSSYMAPLRMAALNLKQFIDTSFGTQTNYDPADLMAYIIACTAAWTMGSEIRRNIRLVFTYLRDQFPQFLPMGLFALLRIADDNGNWDKGQGFSYAATTVRTLIDQYNRIVEMFNRLPLPKEMAVFGYNDVFFEALYADTSDLESSQLYVFQTSHYWKYRPTISLLGSHVSLEAWPITTIQGQLELWEAVVEELTALRTSDTTMLQNLYNAYGTKEFARMAKLDPTNVEGLPIVYDEHILMMIENMNWGLIGANATEVTDIQTLSANSEIDGHVCATNNVASRWPNLPLQFHKPFNEVTHDDIGWALRMHPIFMENKSFKKYEVIPANKDDRKAFLEKHPRVTLLDEEYTIQETIGQGMTADSYTGFAIPSLIRVITFTSASWAITTWNYRSANGEAAAWYESVFNDFQHAPMFLHVTVSTPDEHHYDVNLDWYDAHRDTELTYRLGDVSMFWTYLTEDLYAGSIIRETLGTRKLQRQL